VTDRPLPPWSIWAFAAGYFAAYVPYAAVTKALTSGARSGGPSGVPAEDAVGAGEALSGVAVLPGSITASVVTMALTLALTGLWRSAGRARLGGLRLPAPGPYTALSGVASAVIVMTTTLAYTFDGTSIVLVMLLLRGGVLVIAPIVDAVTGRRVRVASWIGLGASLLAVVVAFAMRAERATMSAAAVADVVVYVVAYFVRLRFMGKLAKSESRAATLRYFVEEQMVTTPVALATLGIAAATLPGPLGDELRLGFAVLAGHPNLGWVLLVGALSAATGIFGGLVLLDTREATFAVPVNRGSSLVAGVCAGLAAHAVGRGEAPDLGEGVGAALVVVAVGVLAVGGRERPGAVRASGGDSGPEVRGAPAAGSAARGERR
jgi:hypothetical protein